MQVAEKYALQFHKYYIIFLIWHICSNLKFTLQKIFAFKITIGKYPSKELQEHKNYITIYGLFILLLIFARICF